MLVQNLQCTECSATADHRRLQHTCPACARPLAVVYDLEKIRARVSPSEISKRPPGIWRYREVLPLEDPAGAVTLGEGGTPLLPAPRLARALGLENLLVKDEALNPTGSFKARGMSVAVSMARALGATALAVPSAGNAGGALAAYGARAGLPVTIAMPADVPRANILEALACGARVELIEGTIGDCGRWIAERSVENAWFDMSTLKEPYRVEGKKTMGYEIAEQLGWSLPDVILYPTGGGTGLVGMAKAFDEMRRLGWIDPRAAPPRMIAVQANGCAPIASAFRDGLDEAEPPRNPHTIASGLRVPGPIGDRWMLRVIRASGGMALSVDDEEILEGSHRMAASEGLFGSPESGALAAALGKLVRRQDVGRGETVVLFNTGTGLKYQEAFTALNTKT